MAMRLQYEDFDPRFDEKEQPTAYVLHVYLPDFLKQQLKVTYDDSTMKMRARGERPLGNRRWSRFDKEFTIPDNCVVSQIRGKFEKNVLIITMPKKVITHPPQQPQPKQEAANPKMDKPARFPTPMPNTEPKSQKLASAAEIETQKEAVEPMSPPKPSSKRTHKRVEDESSKKPANAIIQDPWNKEAQDLVSSAKEVMGKLAKRVKEDENSRQSLINAGVAALVIVALGAYIAYTIESKN